MGQKGGPESTQDDVFDAAGAGFNLNLTMLPTPRFRRAEHQPPSAAFGRDEM